MQESPSISVIIPTYNRAGYLRDTLRSLVDNDLPSDDFEIIVVDNDSDDGTQEMLTAFTAAHEKYHIRSVVEKNQGASYSRNRSIEEANAPLLLFVDDDEIADERLISAWISFFKAHPEALGGGGRIEVRFEDKRPPWMSHFLMPLLGEHHLSNHTQKYGSSDFPFAGNMAYRRETFERYGKLKTDLGRKGGDLLAGEEREFYHRLRNHTDQNYHVPKAKVYHRVDRARMSKEFIRKQAIGLGQSMAMQQEDGSTLRIMKEFGSEMIKIAGTLVLSIGYALALQPSKAEMLVKFRWWIWKGYAAETQMNDN